MATPTAAQHVMDIAQKAASSVERVVVSGTCQLGRRAFLLLVNLLVAAVVMSLPFIASAAGHSNSQPASTSASVGSTSLGTADGGAQVARAATQARGLTITAPRTPATALAEGTLPMPEYTLSKADTLWTIANFYGLTAESIAFANGITDPYHLELGKKIVIPPHDGALYNVKDGDTVESVAKRFKVDPAVIKDYNRLYFEPQNFAPGERIFVENAALPTLPPPPQANASVIVRPVTSGQAAQAGGYLAWPVNGVITQYMWAGHTGVDIAAPYGSGLAASVDGVISENRWVAVGGLHICVTSGSLQECYYHLSAAYLPVGTPVSAGEIVAAIGLTGVTTGPHVHWETKINGQFVNPLTVQP